jgi:hypothetical protein
MPAPTDPHAAAGKLAQLLGETIVHHAPWTAEVDAETRKRYTHEFLEGLESHTANQVGPFLAKILDATDPPPEIRSLIEEAIAPPAQFSAFLEQIFLYGIVSSIIGASVQPFLQGITNDVSTAAVKDGIYKPVDPSVIATAAGRGLNLGDKPTVTVPDWAYTQAAQSGVSADDINLQASLVGLPPALQELFELYRRDVITLDEVKTGLKEGDFRDDWVDYAVQLAHGWLTPLDFVRAAVQAQMTYSDAAEWANKTGLDTSTALPLDTGGSDATPDMFGLAFSIAGRPPGPEELARAANRGDIPWEGTGADKLTFQQGIAESDVKTKWTPLLEKLAVYVPPPESVGSLLERGAITGDQAIEYWTAGGVPPELAKGYEYVASQEHVGQDKLLARGQIISGYFDGIFTKDQATGLLDDLGYRADVASDILDIADFRREIQAINSVVRRISTLYAGYKLTATDAQAALVKVGVPAEQASTILGTWSTLREEPVRLPTVTEIGGAVKYGTITQDEALSELAKLGYQERDAAIVLSAHAEAIVKPLPAAGTTVTG